MGTRCSLQVTRSRNCQSEKVRMNSSKLGRSTETVRVKRRWRRKCTKAGVVEKMFDLRDIEAMMVMMLVL